MIFSVFKKFPRAFWVSNIIELFERWAWYGFYMAFALYLVGSKETGALGMTSAQKGTIMGVGTWILYLLPLFTGAISDRVGYKKMLIISFTMYIVGYFMIGYYSSFATIFASYIFLAVAGATFKPIISAMISKTTTKETSSIGFGIFYMMVNIGAFIGPFIAGAVYDISWNYVFYISMAAISINYFFVFFFFKEPGRDSEKLIEPIGTTIKQALRNIVITLSNGKYVLFLLIMVAFWTAFNQLYYTLPIFIDDWVSTSNLYNGLHSIWPWLATKIGTAEGTISAVTIVSMDAFFIITLQVIISGIVMRFRPLNSIISGILILSIGLVFMFATNNGYYAILGLLIFGIGEMASSPKFTEYVGSNAPPDKKALFMGTSYLPLAFGHLAAGWLSGDIYDTRAGKFSLLKKEVTQRGLEIPEVSDTFTQTDYSNMAGDLMGMDKTQLTQYLWETHHPQNIWMLYVGIAVGAAVVLFLYDRLLMKSKSH